MRISDWSSDVCSSDLLLYKAPGGSTGEPLRFGYTRESYERRTAVMLRGCGWTGATLGRRALYLWGGAVGEQSRATDLNGGLYHAVFPRRILHSLLLRESNLTATRNTIADPRPGSGGAICHPYFRILHRSEEERREG